MLLRVVCGAALLIIGTSDLWGGPDAPILIRLFSCLTGALMLAGLWTPVAASCHVILQGVFACNGGEFASTHLVLALIGASLVMLGPGAWSIDARLYGRKRIDLDHP